MKIYYRRQVSGEKVRIVLQLHCEGTSLRGISRISGLSYNTGVSLIRAGSQKAQLVHNAQVQAIDTDAKACRCSYAGLYELNYSSTAMSLAYHFESKSTDRV